MDIIKISGIQRFLTRQGMTISNEGTKQIVLGKKHARTLDETTKKKLIKLIDETVEELKNNISKS